MPNPQMELVIWPCTNLWSLKYRQRGQTCTHAQEETGHWDLVTGGAVEAMLLRAAQQLVQS